MGLVPIALWVLVGPRRRAELRRPDRRPGRRVLAVAVAGGVVAALLVVQPWRAEPDRVQATAWLPVQDALTDVNVPDDLQSWEIQGGLVTRGTRRLLLSLFDTYDRSKVFYRGVRDRVDEITDQLHEPGADETVAVLVSDRHDNIGMDEVVRAVADEAGATVVLTPATTPRPARPGSSSASTPWTPPSRGTTRRSPSPATTTTARS